MNMKKMMMIAAFGLAGASASAALVITEVMSNSSHPGGAGNGDWFEIYNSGASAIDLTGWSWDDDSATAGTHNFPSITLGVGGIALVVDESSANISGWAVDTWGFTLDATYVGPGVLTTTGVFVLDSTLMGSFSGLGAGGDEVFIFDSSNNEIDSFATGNQSAPNAGFSFARDNTGVDLGRSANGVNGAFIAPGNGVGGSGSDVASPGAVIPEPSTILLVALTGLAAFAGLRNRRK